MCVYALVTRSVDQCQYVTGCMCAYALVTRSVDQCQYVTGCMCAYALVTRSVDQCQYMRVCTVHFGRQVMATVSAYSAEAAATCWGWLLHLHLQQHSW